MTKIKRTAVQFFNDAEKYSLEPLIKTDLNDENVNEVWYQREEFGVSAVTCPHDR